MSRVQHVMLIKGWWVILKINNRFVTSLNFTYLKNLCIYGSCILVSKYKATYTSMYALVCMLMLFICLLAFLSCHLVVIM